MFFLSMFPRLLPLACLCLLTVTLSACGGKQPPLRDDTPDIQQGMIKDLKVFPQDLQPFAQMAGIDTPLVTPIQQMELDASFNRIYFGPWSMKKAYIKSKAFRQTFGKARGYNGVIRWTPEQWEAIKTNANIKAYPSRQSPAITLRQTNLRELPTMQPRYSKPTPDPSQDPFDYFQYSALPPGMPLFISHVSRDRQWYFVENPMAAGWVPSADVAPVNQSFMDRYRDNKFVALIKDNVNIANPQGVKLGHAHIGAIFPMTGKQEGEFTILYPVRDTSGYATTSAAVLQDTTAVVKPLPLQPQLLANVGNEMIAQPYGWGGTNEFRDCSSTLRDLYTPFGLWLPRNSAAQYKAGNTTPLMGMDPKDKESTILREGIPFMTVLWLRGHIGLYVGKYKGRAAYYHNVWGIRVDEQGRGDDRHVIGRCVITSLEPGKELRNAYKDQTLLNRIGGMSTLPRAQ